MRNKVFILTLSVVLVLCSSFSVFGLSSIDIIMTEPATSDTQGYLVVTDSTGSHKNVFYWSIQPYKASETLNNVAIPSMNLIIDEDEITFTALHTGSARVTLTRVYNSYQQDLLLSSQFTTSLSTTYSFSNPISDFCYSGNIGVVDDNISGTQDFLSVNWGSDDLYQQQFDELLDLLDAVDSRLSDIYVRLGSMNSKLDDLDNIVTSLNTLNGTVANVVIQLRTINGHLDDIIFILDEHTIILNDIRDILDDLNNSTVSNDTTPMDDSSIGDLSDSESGILSDSSDFEDVQLTFGNGFNTVWDMVSQAWQSNPKVFTVVIMCLTIGLLKLILNR